MPSEFEFVFNPAAGKGRARLHATRIRETLDRVGVSGSWKETSAPGEGARLAEQAAAEGSRGVVAVGGDGTVNEVVGGLMRVPPEKRPLLGMVPIGTGNDYATLAGLKKNDLDGAAATLREGRTRRLDAGEVNGRFFANSVGLGFDGTVAENAEHVRLVGGFPAYLVSVFRTLATWRNFGLLATADGVELEGRTFLIAVGIGSRCGGGFYLTPDAVPDDGLFDLCQLGDFGKLEALLNLPKALTGTHVRLEKARLLRAKEVTIVTDRPVTAHLDGNLMPRAGHPDPLVFRLHPLALSVIGRWGRRDGAQGRS